MNHTGLANASLNVSIINKNTNITNASYNLNTSAGGEFYSRSDYYSTAPLIPAPSTAADYYLKVIYIGPNNVSWWTQSEIQIVNQTVDRLTVSGNKASYNPSQTMIITVEAIQEVGGRITHTSNVSINLSIRNTAKTILSSFSCITGASGKCRVKTTAPSSYGDYFIEVNNFKGFGSFEVSRFDVNIQMKDELGKSIKHIFDTGEQASVECGVITNSTTETYTFDGVIKDSSGDVIKNISSTTLEYNNSYTNRFTFTLDALTFSAGTYLVEVNITKTGGGIVSTSTSFKVRSWDLMFKKKDLDSGFEYEYSVFPNKTINLEIYPKWRENGSVINDINTTTSINVSLTDGMNNQLQTANATWNASCGKEGCYEFSLKAPSDSGKYYTSVIVSHSGEVQTAKKRINVISTSIFAQSTDKDGTLKELFGTNEYVYISLSAKNTTANTNLSEVSVVAVLYMNGSESNYSQANNFDLVNASNDDLEWAWNSTLQRLKLDTPKTGGLYTIYLTADNNTAATSAKFIVNPYDICLVAKTTAGTVDNSNYYYVYQFKTGDTVYFELKITQANNPTGRATFSNGSSNSSYGTGSACADQSSTKQAVNNATVTVEDVINTQTGKIFSLNTSESACQADDEKGSYTCTIKPIGNWDGGSYGVKFKIISQEGETSDIAYAGFDARAFYLYAWSTNWQNKPTSDIALNVYMYEAGNNWWGSYGSGGLSGTVEVQKIEYQGRDGEWLWPPIEYGYNISKLNTSSVTNGQGSLTLSVNHTPAGNWKSGSYRVVLKGIDNGGNNDYGYAWFQVKRWQVYASPVDCSGTTCNSMYNINSKSNISLYVTINNAGEWGQSGANLGGTVNVSVKKIKDCRKWPCTDLNSSLYNSTSINVSTSSGWYWGTINTDYIINLTPTTGSWGTGYWQVVLDVNGTETGSGWFNTLAFYAEARPTDVNGTNYKYSIKNNQPKYFKITTVKSQKSGYYYASYNTTDYLNTTIDSAVLRTWDQDTYKSIEYNYPTDFNITLNEGGNVINGTRVINVTYNNGSWPSGYYNGELTLKNLENETATASLWFQVRPFRVQISRSQYSIDNDVCINGTISVYDPDWRVNTVLNGTYNITSVTERTWTAFGSDLITYTNYTPTGSFNGNTSFEICYNGTKWGSGSWGNYHYLTVKVENNESNTENGWLSFRTIPFLISWGSIVGGTDVTKGNPVIVPVSLTKASSGASTSGNLTRLHQWRSDNYQSTREEYEFSIGICDTRTAGVESCMVNGTKNVTIYAPSGGWKSGYNYLQAEWTEYNDASSKVEDQSGIWFNGVDAYNGWWNNVDENGNWKYYFGLDRNLTIKLYIRDSGNNLVTVNITKVEYSTPSTGCWDEYCRNYNTATYSIVGQVNNQTNDNGIIKIIKGSANWTRGYIYIKATVNGANGTTVIKNGRVYVKDLTAPTVNVTSPSINETINGSGFWINWTTNEDTTCYFDVVNYDNYHSWYCSGWEGGGNSSNVTTSGLGWVDSCNTTKYNFNSSTYYSEWVYENYRSWASGGLYGWNSGSTGLVTGGTTHYYQFSSNRLLNQSYGIVVWCNDEDWNYKRGYSVFTFNVSGTNTSTTQQNQTNVTLLAPTNGNSLSNANVTFNYSFSGPSSANCSLYGNYSGSWGLNTTSNSLGAGNYNFNLNLTNGTYIWNVYCVDISNSSNTDWGDQNWTFTLTINSSSPSSSSSNVTNVTLVYPTNGLTINLNLMTFNYSFSGPSSANCSLYGNYSGGWTLNTTDNNLSSGANYFSSSWINSTYKWNVYCVDYSNATNFDWGDQNWTFTNNYTG